jgi:hypothetical protein
MLLASQTADKDSMIPNNALKRMWRELVMPKFQVISKLLQGGTEEI